MLSNYFEHLDFYNNPIRLPEEYRSDPIAFLEDFFCDYHLVDLRSIQDAILETCLTRDNPPFDNREKRASLILLHKNLELLFEATILLFKERMATIG